MTRHRSSSRQTLLSRNGFENQLWNVEVRGDVLDVVVVLELLDQADQLLRRRLLRHLHRGLRDHRQLGGLDVDTGGLDRVPDG